MSDPSVRRRRGIFENDNDVHFLSVKPKRRREIFNILSATYPEPASELNFTDEYQLIVSVILSAQTTDKKVNEVTPGLFQKYRDFKSLGGASLETVGSLIRGVNYHPTKAKNLINMAKMVMKDFHGALPHTHEELMILPGVGRKTASVVLSERGVAHALAVDTHVYRVSRRLGFTSGTTPREVEEDLKQQFEPEQWRTLHHLLILHGRKICKARRPLCEICPLQKLCPSAVF